MSMVLFDAILPTLDVYGDASLVGPWYHYGHYRYAGLMTIPMALNYILTFIKWCAWKIIRIKSGAGSLLYYNYGSNGGF